MEIKNMTGSITPCHVLIFILSIESSHLIRLIKPFCYFFFAVVVVVFVA